MPNALRLISVCESYDVEQDAYDLQSLRFLILQLALLFLRGIQELDSSNEYAHLRVSQEKICTLESVIDRYIYHWFAKSYGTSNDSVTRVLRGIPDIEATCAE